MKPSHFETPRTLDEATFYPWGDPIDKPQDSIHPADVVLYVLGLIFLIIVWMVL